MAAVWMRFRAELRGRSCALLVVALLVGLTSSSTITQCNRVVSEAAKLTAAVNPERSDALGVQRPSDIVAYDRVRSTPLYLALNLAFPARTVARTHPAVVLRSE